MIRVVIGLICAGAFWTTLALAETRVLVLGDSLTEGYGVSSETAFPKRLQALIQASGRKDVLVVAAGVSGATSASGVSRLKWYLRTPPEILVIALGGNDLLRGIKPQATKENLQQTIRAAKDAKVKVVLAGMRVPPNYGQEYVKEFEKIYPDLAKTEKIKLIPFLLEDVAGNAQLNQDDGIHPNEKGHEIMANTVFKILKQVL